MKSILVALSLVFLSASGLCEIPKWAIEAYKNDEEIKKAEAALAGSDAKLKTAIEATEYARKLFDNPKLFVVAGMILDEETEENEWNLQKGDVVWWIVNQGWLDDGFTDMIFITAKDGTHLIKKDQNQSAQVNPCNPLENPRTT